MKWAAYIVSVFAVIVSAVALIISLGHVGPAGPRGPQGARGNTGQNAEITHLGVCESTSTETFNNYDPPVTVITSIDIYSPEMMDGVPSCPSGSFVSVVPQSVP